MLHASSSGRRGDGLGRGFRRCQRVAAALSNRGQNEPRRSWKDPADQSGVAARNCWPVGPHRWAARCEVVPATAPMRDQDRPTNRAACTAGVESFLDVSELPGKVVDDKFRQDAIEMTIPLGERGGASLPAVDTVGRCRCC